MQKVIFVFVCFFSLAVANAQELKMNVSVKIQETKTADPQLFKALERSVAEFYNKTQWTDDNYEDEEKIECDMQITIKEELSATSFTADIVIQAIRPVYGSNYSTQILNHIDKGVFFRYQELDPIQDNSEIYTDNLSSILSFYAYIILGMDYDSFSEQGGDPYFNNAKNIVTNVPSSSGDDGWTFKGGVTRNRNKLISDLLNPSVVDFRKAFYEYHRLGLDTSEKDPLKFRAIISNAVQTITKVEKDLPNSMIVKIFADCKFGELVEIFKPAETLEKRKMFNMLVKLDPAQADELQALK
jgi:hypothetical protein